MLSDTDLRVIVLARSNPDVFNIRYDNMIAMAGMARELLQYREAFTPKPGLPTKDGIYMVLLKTPSGFDGWCPAKWNDATAPNLGPFTESHCGPLPTPRTP